MMMKLNPTRKKSLKIDCAQPKCKQMCPEDIPKFNLSLDLLYAHVLNYLSVKRRWRVLCLVNRKWSIAALASVRNQKAVDLTWCRGERQLANAVNMLLHSRVSFSQRMDDTLHQLGDQADKCKLAKLSLFGPLVTAGILQEIIDAIGVDQLQEVSIESKQLNSSGFQQLARCTNLRRIKLKCIKLGSNDLANIALHNPQLSDVDISGCSFMDDNGVIAVAMKCLELKSINLSLCHRLSDQSIIILSKFSLQLTNIVLDQCIKISQIAVSVLVQNLRSIQCLSLNNCPKMNNQTLAALGSSKNYNLKKLYIRCCTAISAEGISALIKNHELRNLESLNLSGINPMESSFFQMIPQFKCLTHLNLEFSRCLSNQDIENISFCCSNLQTVLIGGCISLDDTALFALSYNTPKLENISLVFCYLISDIGFCALINGCIHLTQINVKACNQLSKTSINELCKKTVPLKYFVLGACADNFTTHEYAVQILKAHPRCQIRW